MVILIIICFILLLYRFKKSTFYNYDLERLFISKLSEEIDKFDKDKEINDLLQIQKKYNKKERTEIACEYDDINKKLKPYFSKKEFNYHYNKINPYILNLKKVFNFPRPNEIDSRIDHVYLDSAQTRSFPSGHSAQYKYFSLVAKDKNIDIDEICENGGKSRIIAGVHYNMDHEGGKLLGELLYQYINHA